MTTSMKERFEGALPFDAYLKSVEKNAELWEAVATRARIAPDLLEEARRIPGRWHLLALSEDWCGDAVNTLPVIAALADALPNLELRVLSRDENPDLMDAHLTDGRSRSIPVVMVLDEAFRECGWWGPRPGPLQEWVMEEGLSLPSEDRYREARKFYARDRGQTTLRELLGIMEPANCPC